jgi:uncharacterized protein (TIGR02996 family)
LQAIVEAPADDAARLVFADWLDEQDDRASRDLAAFIRVQYALEALPADDPGRPQLVECQRDLLLAHEGEWKSAVRGILPADYGWWAPAGDNDNSVARWSFRRGFLEKVRIDPASLVQNTDRLRQSAPLRDLQLEHFAHGTAPTDRLDTLLKLEQLPLLDQVEQLDLAGVAGDADLVRCILHSPRLTRLTRLRIDFSQQTWSTLASSPHLPRLRELVLTTGSHSGTWMFASEDYQRHIAPQSTLASLSVTALPQVESLSLSHWGHIPADGMQLIASLDLPRLRQLDLAGNALGPADLRALFDAPFIDQVEDLDLGHNRLGDPGCRALASARTLPRLRRLVLSSNQIDRAAVRRLADCDAFPALEALHLRTNRLGDDGIAALLRGRLVARLRALHLGYNQITSRGALDLADALPEGLAVLDLSWNPIGDAGVAALVLTDAARLAALDLSYCQVGDAAAVALARAPSLAGLRTLNLGTNRVGGAGLAALARSQHLHELRALNLGNNPVDDAGAQALLDSPLFRRLEALHLLGTAISTAMRERMRREFRGILG